MIESSDGDGHTSDAMAVVKPRLFDGMDEIVGTMGSVFSEADDPVARGPARGNSSGEPRDGDVMGSAITRALLGTGHEARCGAGPASPRGLDVADAFIPLRPSGHRYRRGPGPGDREERRYAASDVMLDETPANARTPRVALGHRPPPRRPPRPQAAPGG